MGQQRTALLYQWGTVALRGRMRLAIGVAKTEVAKFADGLFRVVQYWVIGQRGCMTHSCLHLSALTPTGGLRLLNQPAKCGKVVPQ